MMSTRALHVAFALLVLIAPLGAAVCAACEPGHCSMFGLLDAGRASEPVEDGPSDIEASDLPPCHQSMAAQAEAAADAAPPVGDSALTSICCADVSLSSLPSSAIPAAASFAVAALDITPSVEAPAADQQADTSAEERPPDRTPSSLYTLHSAFLI